MIPLLLAAALAAPVPGDGGTPLFNGKDLAGWVNVNCAPNTFAVKGNAIVTTGSPTGFLRTARQYENFVLDLEWMHTREKGMANSGLFVWGDPLPAVGTGYTRGIEVQVLINYKPADGWATSHGDLFSIWGARCVPDRPHPKGIERCLPSEERVKGAGQWNHYRVTATDGVLKLAVNGKEVSGVSKCNPRKGYLALESEGAECHFRNLRIQELPSTDPKPEACADVWAGHTSLFDGLTLGGFTGDGWTASDGVLRSDGKADLVTDKAFAAFDLIFDCKVPAKGAGDWSVELGTNQLTTFTNPDAALGQRGKWNRVRLTAGPDGVTREVNGRVVSSAKPGVTAGPIRFKPTAGLEVRNLFLHETKGK